MARKKNLTHFRDLAVFKNKITDSMMEASETQCWLGFCLACKYINQGKFDNLDNDDEQIIAMLNYRVSW